MAAVHIADLEAAINYWRQRCPTGAGLALAPEVAALAEAYGAAALARAEWVDEVSLSGAAMQAWLTWYATTPDAPCIAICSTSQGDDVCKGCGRSFDEVQHWTAFSPLAKRAVWQRITREGTAWRFNRYAERGQA